jgi:hypothetical protein
LRLLEGGSVSGGERWARSLQVGEALWGGRGWSKVEPEQGHVPDRAPLSPCRQSMWGMRRRRHTSIGSSQSRHLKAAHSTSQAA